MRKFIILAIGILWMNFAFGTGQIPDYLILGNDTIAIFSNPLEQYFEKTGKRELIDFSGCGSTACWRGYIAIWVIKNDSLFLNRITSCWQDCPNSKDANLKVMFGEEIPFANWVNGNLIAPKGKRLRYIHMGYASIFEKEQIFKIKNGKVKVVKVKANKKEARQIHKENRTIELTEYVLDTIFQTLKTKLDWNKLESSTYFCDDEYFLTFGKRGKIRKVKFAPIGDGEILADWWYNVTELRCRKNIKKALKSFNLDYMDLDIKAKINIDIFYDDENEELELWRPYWLEERIRERENNLQQGASDYRPPLGDVFCLWCYGGEW